MQQKLIYIETNLSSNLMNNKIFCLFMFLLVSQAKAQLGRDAHATFYKKDNGKKVQLCFNKKYYLKLKASALPKLNDYTLVKENQTYLKLLNQIGDTLIFKEGKLLANDIEMLISTNTAKGWYLAMAATIYIPFVVTFTYLQPEDRIYMSLFLPVALLLTNRLLIEFERNKIMVVEYELTHQNQLGKEPIKKWDQF